MILLHYLSKDWSYLMIVFRPCQIIGHIRKELKNHYHEQYCGTETVSLTQTKTPKPLIVAVFWIGGERFMTTVVKFCSSWASWMRLSVFLTEYPIWVSLIVWWYLRDNRMHMSSFLSDAKLPFSFRIFLVRIDSTYPLDSREAVSSGWIFAGIIVEERILSRDIHYILGSSAILRTM